MQPAGQPEDALVRTVCEPEGRTLVVLSWRPAMLRALSLAEATVHHGSELSADLSDQSWSPFQKSGTETLGGGKKPPKLKCLGRGLFEFDGGPGSEAAGCHGFV